MESLDKLVSSNGNSETKLTNIYHCYYPHNKTYRSQLQEDRMNKCRRRNYSYPLRISAANNIAYESYTDRLNKYLWILQMQMQIWSMHSWYMWKIMHMGLNFFFFLLANFPNLSQSFNWSIVSRVTLKDMGKHITWIYNLTQTKHSQNYVHILHDILYTHEHGSWPSSMEYIDHLHDVTMTNGWHHLS